MLFNMLLCFNNCKMTQHTWFVIKYKENLGKKIQNLKKHLILVLMLSPVVSSSASSSSSLESFLSCVSLLKTEVCQGILRFIFNYKKCYFKTVCNCNSFMVKQNISFWKKCYWMLQHIPYMLLLLMLNLFLIFLFVFFLSNLEMTRSSSFLKYFWCARTTK